MWKRNTTFLKCTHRNLCTQGTCFFYENCKFNRSVLNFTSSAKNWYQSFHFAKMILYPFQWNIWIINVKKGAAHRFLYRFLALWSCFYLHICNSFFVQLFASPKSISNINLYPLIFFFSKGILQSRFIDWWIHLKSPFIFSDSASLLSFTVHR